MDEPERISYAADLIQLKMMRLLSNTVRQNVTLHCKNSNGEMSILTDENKTFQISAAPRGMRTRTLLDECKMVDNQWHRKVIEIFSDRANGFPVQDIGKHVNKESE